MRDQRGAFRLGTCLLSRAKAYALLGALALLVNVPVMLLVAGNRARFYMAGDAEQYQRLAVNLLDHGVFSRSLTAPYEPDIVRTPGYPAFVAAVYAIGSRSELWVVAAQALLRSALAILIAVLGERVFACRRIGLLSGGLWVVAPIPLLFTGMISSELVFTVFFLAGLILLLPPATGWRGLAAGLLTGAGILVRPVGVVLLPGLLALIFLHTQARRVMVVLGLFVVGVASALTPWFVRSNAIYGTPLLSTIGSNNLLNYTAASYLAHDLGLPLSEGQALAQARYAEYLAGKEPPSNAAEVASAENAVAFRILLASPLKAAVYMAIDSLNTLRPGVSYTELFLDPQGLPQTPPPGRDVSPAASSTANSRVRTVAAVLLLFYLPLLALALTGAFIALRKRNWLVMLALVYPSLALLAAPGAAGNARFRIPFEPLLCVLAAQAVLELASWVRKRRADRPA